MNLSFLWNTIPFNIVNSTSYGAFKSKLKSFFYLTLVLCFCAVVVVVVLCIVYHIYCFLLLVLVACCTWGSTYYRPGPQVCATLSLRDKINSTTFLAFLPKPCNKAEAAEQGGRGDNPPPPPMYALGAPCPSKDD